MNYRYDKKRRFKDRLKQAMCYLFGHKRPRRNGRKIIMGHTKCPRCNEMVWYYKE